MFYFWLVCGDYACMLSHPALAVPYQQGAQRMLRIVAECTSRLRRGDMIVSLAGGQSELKHVIQA